MKNHGFLLLEINCLIVSINVSVIKSVTNPRCVHCVVALVNTSIYASNDSVNIMGQDSRLRRIERAIRRRAISRK